MPSEVRNREPILLETSNARNISASLAAADFSLLSTYRGSKGEGLVDGIKRIVEKCMAKSSSEYGQIAL